MRRTSYGHLDPELWAATQNPWVILRTVSKDKIKSLLAQPEFRQRLDELLRQNRESFSAAAWFQKKHPDAAFTSVAYFSMEFMLSEALPIYSGGLGNVAGDQMKAASDLGVPWSVSFALGSRILSPGFRLGRTAARTLPGERSGPVAHPAAAASKRRVAQVSNSTARLEDLAALLGSVCWKNEALFARFQ